MTRSRGAITACLLLAGCGARDDDCPRAASLVDADGATLATVCVTLATTEADRVRGLQGAAPLAPDEGLLLVYPVEDPGGVCIQNGGVSFAIDALFADSRGLIVHRELRVPAGDGIVRCSDAPTGLVLELAAGAAPDDATALRVPGVVEP